MRINKFLLIGLVIWGVGLGVRLWEITRLPVSLTMDEVAIGYGAFSMLHTGRDEKGAVFPVAPYSVGDYKPPVNYYLLTPVIGLLGLTELAVRLPAVIAGSLAGVVFWIGLRRLGLRRHGAIFGGLWLAVVPWYVHFSRFGTEAVVAVCLLLAGLVCGLTGLGKQNWKWLVAAVTLLSLSVWAYHSARLFVPLLVLVLIPVVAKQAKFLLKQKRGLVMILVTAIIWLGPFMYLSLATPAIRERAAMTSILREQSLILAMEKSESTPEKIYNIFHHWAGKYMDYFDLRFWFWKGMSFTLPGYPDSGLLYLADGMWLLVGIWAIVMSKQRLVKYLAVVWMFLGPFPASLTMNNQHPLRALIWIPWFGLLVAAGWAKVRGWKWKGLYVVFLIWNIFYVKDLYQVQLPKYYSEFWQYGFKEAALYGCEHQNEYDRVVIGPTFGSAGPEMTGIPDYYVLFYCQYPPQKYLATRKIEKFDFYRVDWRNELQKKDKALLISGRWDYPNLMPPAENVIKQTKYLNEEPAFFYVETRGGQ